MKYLPCLLIAGVCAFLLLPTSFNNIQNLYAQSTPSGTPGPNADCTTFGNDSDRNICEHLGSCELLVSPEERNRCRAAEVCTRQDGSVDQSCVDMSLADQAPSRPEGSDSGQTSPPGIVNNDLGGGGGPPSMSSSLLQQGFCIRGYVQLGELCIQSKVTSVRGVIPQGGGRKPIQINGLTFAQAQVYCGGDQLSGRIATYADYYNVFLNIDDDGTFNPNGLWLGPTLVGDDEALVGNRDITEDHDTNEPNFEGSVNKLQTHDFRCAYTLISPALLGKAS